MSQSVTIPNTAAAGVYTISLWLPDESSNLRPRPEYAVRFAHSDSVWDAFKGYNILKAGGVEIAP